MISPCAVISHILLRNCSNSALFRIEYSFSEECSSKSIFPVFSINTDSASNSIPGRILGVRYPSSLRVECNLITLCDDKSLSTPGDALSG